MRGVLKPYLLQIAQAAEKALLQPPLCSSPATAAAPPSPATAKQVVDAAVSVPPGCACIQKVIRVFKKCLGHAAEHTPLPETGEQVVDGAGKYNSLYRIHTPQGLRYSADVEEPPPDKAYLFDHWGAGGNTGVSGQQCLPAGAAPPTNTGEEEIGGGRAVGGGVGGGGEYVPWAYQPLVSEPAPKAR